MVDQLEDKALEAEVDLIEKEVAANQAEIPLDQPHPEELTAPRPVIAMPEVAPAPAEKPAPVTPPQQEAAVTRAVTKDSKVKFLALIAAMFLPLRKIGKTKK